MSDDGDACNEAQELAERWRVAGLLLRRINPAAFEALLFGAEVIVVETPQQITPINFADFLT